MTKKHKLMSGRTVEEETKEFKMSISSKCPDKWLFVDLETGDIWHHREGIKKNEYPFWREANKKELNELKNMLNGAKL
jgi:hypothetical protein